MKKIILFIWSSLVVWTAAMAQTPTVYCTYWNGTSESIASLNFTTNMVDSIGKIEGSTLFPVAQANGYDSYRNRYYTISNQGLVAVNASNGWVVNTASQYAGGFKHLSYNPVTDLLFATKYNGTQEEFYQISPETFQIVNQGILGLANPYFALGFYGSDAFANEVIFQVAEPTGSIKTVNMATGAITNSFTKPDYLSNMLMATHDPLTDLYYAVGTKNSRLLLLTINKTNGAIDSVGRIPGANGVSLSGAALDAVNRKFIFVSNLGITVVDLSNPSSTSVIPYPSGAINVKGFQTNAFSAPLPRVQGPVIRAQFKNVEAWYRDGVEIPNSATANFTPTTNGMYRYKVKRPDGTSSMSSEISYSVTGLASSDKNKGIQLFQNQETGDVQITLPESGNAELKCYDAAGKSIVLDINADLQVKTNHLPAGVYQLVVLQNRSLYKKRFLKS